MLHLHYFITRKPSLDEAHFQRYWLETHGLLVRKIPQLKRYVQSHRIASYPDQKSPYDGAAEVWLEDFAALAALKHSPAYLEGALADEPNFIDMSRVEWLLTEDHVFIPGTPPAGAAKMLFPLKRQAGFSHDAGRRYWLDVHGPIVASLPGLVRYMQKATAPAPVNQARVEERKKNLHDLRLENAKVLNAYDWQDQPKGIVRLPVARAMELTLLEYKNPAAARSNLIARADKANVVPPKAPEAPGKYE